MLNFIKFLNFFGNINLFSIKMVILAGLEAFLGCLGAILVSPPSTGGFSLGDSL